MLLDRHYVTGSYRTIVVRLDIIPERGDDRRPGALALDGGGKPTDNDAALAAQGIALVGSPNCYEYSLLVPRNSIIRSLCTVPPEPQAGVRGTGHSGWCCGEVAGHDMAECRTTPPTPPIERCPMVLGRTRLARTIAVWIVVALLVGSVAALSSPATRAAIVPLQPSDALMHAPRGAADGVYRFAEAVGSARLPDTRAYLDEIYRLAPLVGLDPAILIGQSALETGYWRGKFWVSDLNPAGIGITNDDQPTSFHWATGTDAARGHIYHLYVYAAGVPPTGHILHQYRALEGS